MNRRVRRIVQTFVGGAAVAGLACVDMSAPKGPASISGLRLPSPSVIVGDVMRDSLGAPAPITVIAFDANSAPLTDVDAQFFVIDTTKSAHFASGNLLTGDKIGSAVIVAQVGTLQTSTATIPVTYAPAKIAAFGTITPLVAPLGDDSAATTAFEAVGVKVTSSGDSASQGIIVKYALVRAPSSVAGHTAVYIANNSGARASADTTTAAGTSNRRLVVVSAFLSDQALQSGQKTDTAIVEARASYKGALLAGSPVRLTVPIQVALK